MIIGELLYKEKFTDASLLILDNFLFHSSFEVGFTLGIVKDIKYIFTNIQEKPLKITEE